MIIRFFIVGMTFLFTSSIFGQDAEDSIKAQKPFEVVVRAYEQNRRLLEVPVSIGVLNQNDLNRFNNISILPALNTIPGVRMEERSPGSYRLNIRGSSLRSPFGVRNVKIYYNGIPITDPGGNTYLNQFGFYNFQSIEVIKGPGSSLYGAGTGGVMLIEGSDFNKEERVRIDHTLGSYGLSNTYVAAGNSNADGYYKVSYQHLQSDGYRRHSAMDKDVLSFDAGLKIKNNVLSAHLLYGDLYYQTPGALTLAEYNVNARASRPRVGAAPGAGEIKAAIYLKSFFMGADYKQYFSEQWQNTTTLYGAFSELKNPAIRNYGRNSEPHFGGRTVFQYKSIERPNSQLVWHVGAEVQRAFNTVQVFRNKAGNPDSLLSNDEVNITQFFAFSQLSWQLKKWLFTAGISINDSKIGLVRTSNVPASALNRKFENQLAPRFAMLYKVDENVSVYGSIARGFSPPTISELSPSGSAINNELNAETGNNVELGTKGSALQNKLSWDVSAFYYRLGNSIVQRRDALGGDFYINAGSTRQKGLETSVSYRLGKFVERQFNTNSKIWISHTWYHFNYKDFKQLTADFTGKQLPSVAPATVAAGLDLYSKTGLYANITYQYTDPIALNDGNTAYASSYNLLGLRTGYKTMFSKAYSIEIFAGADNLFDVKYSLGNDINAFGGRYFNVAAGRNYFAGVSLQMVKKK